MRKYQQLLLLVISVVSLSLLLIYRHEYNRLHYVLEVFNFFGQPFACNISDLATTQHDYGPIPFFHEIENNYIYSAHLNQQQQIVQAIAVQKETSESKRSCYVYYEDNSTKPVIGKYKYSKLSDKVKVLYCSYGGVADTRLPYAVSFTTKKNRNGRKLLINTGNVVKLRSNVTVCVAPTSYDKKSLLEFVSYHKIIGIDDFVFYADDLPYRIKSILTNLAAKLAITFTFYPWNDPDLLDAAARRLIVEQDCLLRMKRYAKNVVTLDLFEYIVPTYHHTLHKMIHDFDARETTNIFSLPVQSFCVMKRDHREPIALQNTVVDLSDGDNKLVRYIYRSELGSDAVATQAVTSGIASVHRYVDCSDEIAGKSTNKDESILRFASELRQSTLVHLLMHDGI